MILETNPRRKRTNGGKNITWKNVGAWPHERQRHISQRPYPRKNDPEDQSRHESSVHISGERWNVLQWHHVKLAMPTPPWTRIRSYPFVLPIDFHQANTCTPRWISTQTRRLWKAAQVLEKENLLVKPYLHERHQLISGPTTCNRGRDKGRPAGDRKSVV